MPAGGVCPRVCSKHQDFAHTTPEDVDVWLEVASVHGLDALRSVAATTDYGTERANGVWLLEQALGLDHGVGHAWPLRMTVKPFLLSFFPTLHDCREISIYFARFAQMAWGS